MESNRVIEYKEYQIAVYDNGDIILYDNGKFVMQALLYENLSDQEILTVVDKLLEFGKKMAAENVVA